MLKEGSYLGERINSFYSVTVSCYSSGDLVTAAEWADILGQLGGDSVHTGAGLLEGEVTSDSNHDHPSVADTELTWGATEPWREEWSTSAASHGLTVDSINSEELLVGETAQVDSLQIDADVSMLLCMTTRDHDTCADWRCGAVRGTRVRHGGVPAERGARVLARGEGPGPHADTDNLLR